MKNKVAKRGMFLLFVGIFCFMSMKSVAAVPYEPFGGSVDVDYRVVSEPYTKVDTYNKAGVDWTYSNDQKSHDIWFKVVNIDGDRMGSALFTYKSFKYITTSGTKKGENYSLYSERENWWDPWTYVSGTWAP